MYACKKGKSDSIYFFYTSEQLDSARRNSMSENGQYLDEESVSFVRGNGNIIGVKFKTLNFENDTDRFRFIYKTDRLGALKSSYIVDTLIYFSGEIKDIKTYQLLGGGFTLEQYGDLLKRTTIKSYLKRPNPFYLISKRLGFPYFSYVLDNTLGAGNDYYRDCILSYEIEDNNGTVKSGTLGYDYDDMGSVNSIYNATKPDLKTIINYK